jgi:CheY-like chemotaxis protein
MSDAPSIRGAAQVRLADLCIPAAQWLLHFGSPVITIFTRGVMTKHILLLSARQRRAVHIQVELLRYGLLVEAVDTARRGLAIAQHRAPDAIVIDGDLPDLDGTTIKGKLNAAPVTAHIPIVLLAPPGQATETLLERQVGRNAPAAKEPLLEHDLVESLRRAGIL